MFGRLRPPPSPPDCLERYPAKIIKDDPLSVYESTLLKLKQGSTRLDTTSSETEGEENLPSSPSHVFSSDTQGDTHDMTLCNGSDAMAIDSCESSKQLKNKNPSVLSMFSKYKNQAQARNMKTETHNDL
ncbi:unnamed protein product [Arabidopsis lyrata]|uniref:Predicted protein n=1 Tax=Arabidopsis lyrata subsp. lyrata TaxID=81972 RepID=D7LRX5_ARALL|nr:uncharacterized protein LOC9313682 [Arabidopsis lyrata subsp. lyrata]EFH52167.1 predicted protein [Arabidopsis lyrata subsp. lyrata]CAH8267887.1 unnamed protein product [Arabidopsis lyrata]|eukprot:XP_002875908.1 uncharacterized protein LOC9313682 [Arabidopsis lyrata subsp. lyrata]